MNRQDVEWSKFASGLLGYIDAGLSRFIETDYKIDLNMSSSFCTNTKRQRWVFLAVAA